MDQWCPSFWPHRPDEWHGASPQAGSSPTCQDQAPQTQIRPWGTVLFYPLGLGPGAWCHPPASPAHQNQAHSLAHWAQVPPQVWKFGSRGVVPLLTHCQISKVTRSWVAWCQRPNMAHTPRVEHLGLDPSEMSLCAPGQNVFGLYVRGCLYPEAS